MKNNPSCLICELICFMVYDDNFDDIFVRFCFYCLIFLCFVVFCGLENFLLLNNFCDFFWQYIGYRLYVSHRKKKKNG